MTRTHQERGRERYEDDLIRIFHSWAQAVSDYSSNRQRTAEIRVELSRYQTGSRDELGGEHLVVFHSYKVQYLYLKDMAMKISRKREKG